MAPILGIIASGQQASQLTSFESISTVTTTSNTSTITFSSIPSTYKSLQIRFRIADTVSAGNVMYARFNSDSGSNYARHQLWGNGSSAATGAAINEAQYQWWATPNSGTTNPSAGIVDIIDYASTSKFKTSRLVYGMSDTGQFFSVLNSGLWRSTAAINRIDISLFGGGQFGSGVTFALYGIKG